MSTASHQQGFDLSPQSQASQLYLASTSPRRHELLRQVGVTFTPLEIEQDEPSFEPTADRVVQLSEVQQFVSELAQWKARCGVEQLASQAFASIDTEQVVVMGADTVVFHSGSVLEKPKDGAQAKAMLKKLSGSLHQVVSAVAVEVCHVPLTDKGASNQPQSQSQRQIQGEPQSAHKISVTEVTFAELSDSALEKYLATGEYRGKAGSYAIQGMAAAWVSQINGSYSGVMGLPLNETCQLLNQFGVPIWEA